MDENTKKIIAYVMRSLTLRDQSTLTKQKFVLVITKNYRTATPQNLCEMPRQGMKLENTLDTLHPD